MKARQLNEPQAWNVGFLKALALPDGPFKLYVWLRLNARIDTGTIETTQGDLARALNKARGTIRANLRTLEQAGICRIKFQNNPVAPGWIQITDDYWPYDRADSTINGPELRAYLERVRALLHERACIRCAFSAADELLARDWYGRNVSVEHVNQAILLGCARKYVSWRNGARRAPIVSLAYFEPILAELEGQHTEADYWDYTRDRIERLERQWLQGRTSNGPGNLLQATAKREKEGVPGYGRRVDR